MSAWLGCLPVRDLSGYSDADGDRTRAAALPESIDDRAPDRPLQRGISTPGEAGQTPSLSAPPGPTGRGEASANPSIGFLAMDAGATRAPADASSARHDSGLTSPDAGDAVSVAPVPECAPSESAGPSGHCYAVVRDLLTWNSARSRCKGHGSGWDLASIRTEADSRYVHELLAEEVWVGGSDAASEATWSWVDDGLPFWQEAGPESRILNGAFVNWYANEPNGTLTSDCLRLLADASWADFECTELRASICEGPARAN